MLDFLIKDGLVADGSGSDSLMLNVGISGDTIVCIGSDEPPSDKIVDASGLIVSPGFIDTHTHSEFTLLADGRAEGRLSQGVTTEINGNCGLSAAPLYGEAFERRETDLKELDITERWHTFWEYFALLRMKGIAVNFATLCGHGNIRGSVVGYKNDRADDSQLSAMNNLLDEAMKAGARGLSTGLIYPPGVFSTTGELIALSRIAAESGGLYASHMRSEGDALIESIEEAIRIGKEAGTAVHISHLKTAGERNWHKVDSAIDAIETARSFGLRVTCDRYPYIASSTDLDTVLPVWVYEGGYDDELARLKDPETRAKIKLEIGNKDEQYWKGIHVSSTVNAGNAWMEGLSIADIASKMGKSPFDALIEILIDERVRTGAIFFSMSEDNLKRFLSLPYAMIGSDSSVRSFSGVTCKGKPHPRGFGSFPRVIGKYVREEGLLGLGEAIRRMTSLPASTFGLKQRGLIKEGFFADITVFDYQKIADKATFSEPFQKAEGIVHVFVNGIPAMKYGGFTGNRAGRVLL
jgi:N-acyl-D-amino-acid deacylase